MHNFKELKVWKKSIELVKQIYQLTSIFPSEEKFGITSQLRRSAISIPSNIAEGSGRKTDRDFSNFLAISLGSQYELETQLLISKEINLLPEKEYNIINDDLGEIQKMTRSLLDKFSES